MPDKKQQNWFIYMIRCHNGHIYTGITTDVDRRFSQHQSGKGAKYLRGKGPLQLVFKHEIDDHSQALKTEIAIKKMKRSDKENIIQLQILP